MSDKNKNDYQKVMDKILNKIIKDVKIIFEGLSSRDEEIIRESFMVKQDSWNQLGKGIRNVIGIVTPIAFSIYQDEIANLITTMEPYENKPTKEI